MRIKQGTISLLLGCHSIGHSILVCRAWKVLNGSWPRPWQLTCIFLHDIGHWGRDYLDDPQHKREHWVLGARAAARLFDINGYNLTAGHSEHSLVSRSKLYYADKYSWHIAPIWWLCWNACVEPKLRGRMGVMESVLYFKEAVRKNVESGAFGETHGIYLKMQEEDGNGTNCP